MKFPKHSETKNVLASKTAVMVISVELGAWVPLIVEMATGQFRVYMENSMMRNWLLGFVAIQVIGAIVAVRVKKDLWRAVLLVLSAMPIFLLPLLRPALATIFVGY